ncbi:glycosyl transferase family 2 [Emticicia oligotrophica DSM 17448]|uniref:Glycosyl transferase family 2 n=1 Tax=Emticicia oligotrophica (strain DSM 17448 / CIP 109782 / MTCC 6937 / GPTSA100-15) TaxID=929562 RepID=A0ABM5N7D3_EMTOG|nr:glycosyltransferase family 2 protein [Emticicia oligotrophica]AFK05415.1 glycosyl transferase family 2 [Emticicia oligotrophica DSM 17448]
MNLNPKVSIITATFNSDKTLEKSMLSVLSQSYSNIEYIIIDGQSKDKTVDIIKKYESKINFWSSESDKGIYDAWNKGLNKASGDWILFLGSDDFLVDNCLNNYVAFLESNQVDNCLLVSSKLNLIDSNGNYLRTMGWPWKWDKFQKINMLAHPGALHSKKLFEKYGMFDINYNICGDYELLLRPGEKLNALFFNEITVLMTEGGASYNPKLFFEHRRACINTGNLNKLTANYYFLLQFVKTYIKNAFKKIGINLFLRK